MALTLEKDGELEMSLTWCLLSNVASKYWHRMEAQQVAQRHDGCYGNHLVMPIKEEGKQTNTAGTTSGGGSQ